MIPLAINAIFLAASVGTYLFASGFRISAWLMWGLQTYLLMENSSPAAASSVRQQDHQRSSNPIGGKDQSEEPNSQGNGGSSRERWGDQNGRRAREKGAKGSRKKKEKETLTWNESGSQILRISIGDSHLDNRKYYPEFDEAVIYSTLALAALLTGEVLSMYIGASEADGSEGLSIYIGLAPFLVCLVAVYKLIRLLAVVSWEKNLSTQLDWQLSCASGLVGFLFASFILFCLQFSFVDLRLDEAISHADAAARLFIKKNGADNVPFSIPSFVFAVKGLMVVMAGAVSGLFLGPALRSVRCFWLGTDQLGWNLSITSRGWSIRALLSLNMVLPLLTAMLWIRPMTEIFVQDSAPHILYDSMAFHRYVGSLSFNNTEVAGELKLINEDPSMHSFVKEPTCRSKSGCTTSNQPFSGSPSTGGMVPEKGQSVLKAGGSLSHMAKGRRLQIKGISLNTFEIVKFCSMLSVVLLQLGLFRINMQTYFNSGVLVWYQSLHQGRDYDLELTKAKVLLVNYFMCRVTLQILAPGILIILFSGMARSCESCINCVMLHGDYAFAPLLILRESMLFLTWWTVSIWAILTSTILALFRLGFFLAT